MAFRYAGNPTATRVMTAMQKPDYGALISKDFEDKELDAAFLADQSVQNLGSAVERIVGPEIAERAGQVNSQIAGMNARSDFANSLTTGFTGIGTAFTNKLIADRKEAKTLELYKNLLNLRGLS